MDYYNENDPYAAQWLRNLIDRSLIPKGHVDDRSIKDVQPGDLAGYIQCHFFAGIGGWPYALGLAGWPNKKKVWTGSCPCQPFSNAGKHGEFADERHLWPEWNRLIGQCRPATIFGEQVASKAGRRWFALVRSDLEKSSYAVAGSDLCAASVAAPQLRQRLFWTAVSNAKGDRWAPKRQRATPRYADGLCELRSGKEAHWQFEPPLQRLGDGIPPELDALRALGNAIVPQVAAQFIKAVM